MIGQSPFVRCINGHPSGEIYCIYTMSKVPSNFFPTVQDPAMAGQVVRVLCNDITAKVEKLMETAEGSNTIACTIKLDQDLTQQSPALWEPCRTLTMQGNLFCGTRPHSLQRRLTMRPLGRVKVETTHQICPLTLLCRAQMTTRSKQD